MPAGRTALAGSGGFVAGSQVPDQASEDGMDFAQRVAAVRLNGIVYATPGSPPAPVSPKAAGAAHAPAPAVASHLAVAEGNGTSDGDFVARMWRARSSGSLTHEAL